jgi:hypothetical protein
MVARSFTRAAQIALLTALAVACSEVPSGPSAPDANRAIVPGPGSVVVQLCKVGDDDAALGDLFTFNISAPSGTVTTPVQVEAQDIDNMDFSRCPIVWSRAATSLDDETPVTITEVVPAGATLRRIAVSAFVDGDPEPADVFDPVVPSTTVIPYHGMLVLFKNEGEGTFNPGFGRFTGGGNQITVGDVNLTKGFTLHCDITLSNNLEINWPGHKWHLTKPITNATCTDEPNVDPTPPAAPVDTIEGDGIGSLDGVDGFRVHFYLQDSGEGGGKNDKIGFQVFSPTNVLLFDFPIGVIDGGNVQAHYDQPHKQKP